MDKKISVKARVTILKMIVAFTLIIGFVSACTPPAMLITALMPAKFHEASRLNVVTVLPFDGKDGKEFATEVEGILAGVNIGDKQYFTVVERAKLEKIIDEELKLSQTGFTNPATAANIGKAIGAKGIYTGVVTDSRVTDSNYNETRELCISEHQKYDEDLKRIVIVTESKKMDKYTICLGKRENYTVPCTKRKATFAFNPKLIEVETGKVVYSNNISNTATASACQDSQEPLPSEFDIIKQAKQSAKETFAQDISPYYVTFYIELMDSTDNITSKEASNKLEQGLYYAKNNRFDRACELWDEARILSPESASILYNLGVCHESTGEFEQALNLYKKSDRAIGKPDNRITLALRRISEKIQKQNKLKEQLSK